MKKFYFVFFAVLFSALGFFYLINSRMLAKETSLVDISPTRPLLGGDKDEHGCVGSAGYAWCEVKQKCLREWEEKCDAVSDETEFLKSEIKKAIVEKHGSDAENLNITVSKLEGDYAQGGASQEGLGGGMWFAAKVGGIWKLVWDGNGIITCDSIKDYPDFSSNMIPECYNEATGKTVTR